MLTEKKASFKLSDSMHKANVNTFYFSLANYEEPIELFRSDFSSLSYGADDNFSEESLFTAPIVIGKEPTD